MVAHRRKCHDCGNEAMHADNVVPDVLCSNCGSQDTRAVREKKAVESALPIPFDASRVNVLRGKSLVHPTGEDVRELCRMLDWCEEHLSPEHGGVFYGDGPDDVEA